jgi:hypothetical protein
VARVFKVISFYGTLIFKIVVYWHSHINCSERENVTVQ